MDDGGGTQASRRDTDGFLRRWTPACVSVAVSAVSLALQWPLLSLLGAICLVVTAPVGRTLATRVALWAIGSLAAAGLLSVVRLLPVTRWTAAVFLLVGLGLAMAVSRLSGPQRWQPEWRIADIILGVAAILVLLTLTLPYVGAGPDGVLLDLARAYDNRIHYTLVHNLLGAQSVPWSTGDGAAPIGAGYPLGVHVLGAVSVLLASIGDTHHLVGFAAASALAVTFSGLLLGFVAVDITESSGPEQWRGRRGITAAVIACIALPLGGLLSGLFEVGHSAFLYPATVAIAASWLALTHQQRPVAAATVLVVAALGINWSYPPLIGGVLAALAVLALRRSRAGARRWALGLGAFAGLMVVVVLWHWRRTFDFLATASGEFSTPVATSFLMTMVTILLLLVAARAQQTGPALLALTPAAGFAVAAAAIAGLAISVGFIWTQNYYVAKLLQAVWITELPIVIGLSAWLLSDLAGRVPRGFRSLALACGVVFVGLTLTLIPDGRYRGHVSGAEMLAQRLLERDRAQGEVELLAAREALGPSSGSAAVVIEPRGWFHPVADGAIRRGSSASEWLNSLRGVPSERQGEAARCMGKAADRAAEPCLRAWLDRYPDAHLDLVSHGVAPADGFRNLIGAYPGRVGLTIIGDEPAP